VTGPNTKGTRETSGGGERPGLAKTRLSLLSVVRAPRVRSIDARWRALFEMADAVSEGSVREEPGGDFWYGSTSMIVPFPEAMSPAEQEFLAAVASKDLHVRLRAVRIARREAASRAAGLGRALGRSTCEMRFVVAPRGVRIDVDVQAPLIEGRHSGTAGS